ncbi:hypothetical protein MRY82_03945 [bacterium]|nr:hypothetical protein [bacterium]
MKSKCSVFLILSLLLSSCTLFTNRPELVSWQGNTINLCCEGVNSSACPQEEWAIKVQQHCPQGAVAIGGETRERLGDRIIEESIKEDHSYDAYGDTKRVTQYKQEREFLSCVTYKCNGQVYP